MSDQNYYAQKITTQMKVLELIPTQMKVLELIPPHPLMAYIKGYPNQHIY